MSRPIRILALLTALLLFAAVCFWGGLLFQAEIEQKNALIWCGLADAVLSLGVFAALAALCRRAIARAKQQQAEELMAQQRRQSEALSQAAAQNRAEMNAFRSSLAHTLRMPLSIIQGYADLLLSGVVTEEAVRSEYLQKICDRSQYMTEAISRQFSARETLNISSLHYSDLDLLTLVQQAAADMQTAAADQGTTIQVVSSQSSLPIQADGYLLDRVLFNLLENSLKYMGRPGIITIRVDQEGELAALRVQDDGIGLPAEETAHIFEPNFQGSNHTQGQGYGLYLVKQSIESHGGSITAQSAPGRGMKTVITLPRFPRAAKVS